MEGNEAKSEHRDLGKQIQAEHGEYGQGRSLRDTVAGDEYLAQEGFEDLDESSSEDESEDEMERPRIKLSKEGKIQTRGPW